MGVVIDTSALIEMERGDKEWDEVVGRAGEERVYLPAIVWAELLAGVHLADSAARALKRRKRLDSLRERISILDFTKEITETWAELFAELQREGTPIPSNDLTVAATAVYYGYRVLVGNRGEAHFRKIKRLAFV
jgi:tRNA(fMet)-specific endonuclease VapC